MNMKKECQNLKEYVAEKVVEDIRACESLAYFLEEELNIFVCKCENANNPKIIGCKKWCIEKSSGEQKCVQNLTHSYPRIYCEACSDAYTMPFSKDPICHDCFISKQDEHKCYICGESKFNVMLTNFIPPIVVSCRNCNVFI